MMDPCTIGNVHTTVDGQVLFNAAPHKTLNLQDMNYARSGSTLATFVNG